MKSNFLFGVNIDCTPQYLLTIVNDCIGYCIILKAGWPTDCCIESHGLLFVYARVENHQHKINSMMSLKSEQECQQDRMKLKEVLMTTRKYKDSDIEEAFMQYGVC